MAYLQPFQKIKKMLEGAITVRQLNMYAKTLIEGDRRLAFVAVVGELSNFKNHYTSGHWYFTLKDADASIRCVMFKSSALKVNFSPEDGMLVTLKGRVSIYEKDGQFQFYAEEMHSSGDGDLALAFKQVKERLEKEGLFNKETKRPLVKFPKCIAVVTSDTGAAVEDIKNILGRRYPLCYVMICPVSVQGAYAVDEMLATLDRVYSLDSVDTIIIGRGGGSAEDLQAFNDERLARKIYESPVPVISAVGHETDFTICDFVADVRASTPSAAAELAVHDAMELLQYINKLKTTLTARLKSSYDLAYARYSAVLQSPFIRNPHTVVEQQYQTVDNLRERLIVGTQNFFQGKDAKLIQLISKLDALSPLKTLSRGYVFARKGDKAVSSVDNISPEDSIDILFSDGTAECIVKGVKKVRCKYVLQ